MNMQRCGHPRTEDNPVGRCRVCRNAYMKDYRMTGQRFGRWLVLERGDNGAGRQARWICRCDCGGIRLVRSTHLKSGSTASCGCLQKERISEKKTTHGHAGRGGETAEYRTWQAMKDRCYNPRHKFFKNYGGRGITVCDRWRENFRAFLADMGRKPRPELSLDRINNEGNYEPGNCRWATRGQQACNRRQRESA